MLQDIRQNINGTVAKIIVGLIVVAFSLFGIESILLGGGGSGVAEVNGEEISPQELQQAVNNQKRQLISMLGDNLDPAMLEDQRITAQAMESLIQRKLLTQSAQGMDLSISDQQVGAVVGSMEQFHVDGQFSPELYRATLSDVGFTPGSFKQTLQQDMVISQVRSGLSGSEFATPGELALNARIIGEQRDLRYLTIPLEGFASAQDITEEDVNSYYESNSSSFLSQESVELDFIELRAEDFREPVDENVIRDAYEQEIQNTQYQTESRVSHILFEATGDEETLQARIAEVQGKLSQGADFAELAQEYSDDTGSAGTGGDLGFTAGDVFPSEMEQAILELEVDQVSAPVKTDAGTHLILLTEHRAGEAPSFEEMRPQLEDTLALIEARVALLRTVETLKDLVFNAENLESPAEEMGLTVSRSDEVTRSQNEGLFSNTQLLAAVFSDDVLEAGHNSDVIEVDGDHWVVMSVGEHHAEQVMPLAQVREQIVASLTEQRARDAVTVAAINAVSAIRGGTSVEDIATGSDYEWQVELGANRGNEVVPREVLQSAFSLAVPTAGESTVNYVLSANGDALVYELDRVTPGQITSLPVAERQALQQLVGAEYGQLIDNEYQQGLRANADINVM